MAKSIVVEKLNKPRTIPSNQTQIVLVGLTPGRRQHDAINAAENALTGSFKGMRKQIFSWFDALGITKIFELSDENSLFTEKRFEETAYITSLLREPVYVSKDGVQSNYTGRSPFPWHHDALTTMMNETLQLLSDLKNPSLIVPMGQVVSQAIADFSTLDANHQVLHGFPHPSGANGHRHREFSENCQSMKKVVEKFIRLRPQKA